MDVVSEGDSPVDSVELERRVLEQLSRALFFELPTSFDWSEHIDQLRSSDSHSLH